MMMMNANQIFEGSRNYNEVNKNNIMNQQPIASLKNNRKLV